MTLEFFWLTLACGLLTLATRVGGYVLLSQLRTVPPRLEAALDAVPAAVMAALVAPALLSGTWREALALVLCAVLTLRFSLSVSVFAPVLVLVGLRYFT